jgi:TonB family protein
MRNSLVLFFILIMALFLGCSKKQTTEVSDTEKEVANQSDQSDDLHRVSFNRDAEAVETSEPDEVAETNVPEKTETETVMLYEPKPRAFYYPFYPLSLRMEGVEGTVLLEFVIDREGNVIDPKIGSSTEPRFNEYALEAIRESKFFPGLVDDKPVNFPVEFPITYTSEFGTGQVPPDSVFNHLVSNFGTFYVKTPGGHELAELKVSPILRQEPFFPEEMRESKTSGTVKLRFTVTEEGRVEDPEIVESSNKEFEQSALMAIRFWQFIPRIKEGKPVRSQVELPISFGFSEETNGEGQ